MPASASPRRAAVLAAAVAIAFGAAGGFLLAVAGPAASAEVARGSEDAFASGLHPRELPPRQAPIRWTRERALLRFRHLTSGPALLEVSVRDQRAPVIVVAAGAVVGRLGVGETRAEIPLGSLRSPGLDVELRVEPFTAGDGRRLGTRLVRVAVLDSRGGAPSLALPGLGAAMALVTFLAALNAGLVPVWAALAACLASTGGVALLWPSGVARSPYAVELAVEIGVASLAAAVVAWMWRRDSATRRAAFLAALTALCLQGVAVVSPLWVPSDAVFHANKLASVAAGDLFPTSVTQHHPPFRIPYGVSFYALLAPLYRAGVDAVALVRWGAAGAGVAGSIALFALALPLGPLRAALAAILLQLLPGVLDIYSYGNFSNVFGQGVTALFFAWWVGRARGGAATGALLLAIAGLAHLSSLIVLTVLAAALLLARRAEWRSPRARVLAVLIGFAVLALYYAQFWPLVQQQLPRLLEGGGGGAAAGLGRSLASQLEGALGQWGAPVLVLAALGWPSRRGTALDRDLLAFWAAGLVLALFAIVSPLEVRYLYALTLPLAVAAGAGLGRLLDARRPVVALGTALLVAQAGLALAGIADALLHRYRP